MSVCVEEVFKSVIKLKVYDIVNVPVPGLVWFAGRTVIGGWRTICTITYKVLYQVTTSSKTQPLQRLKSMFLYLSVCLSVLFGLVYYHALSSESDIVH